MNINLQPILKRIILSVFIASLILGCAAAAVFSAFDSAESTPSPAAASPVLLPAEEVSLPEGTCRTPEEGRVTEKYTCFDVAYDGTPEPAMSLFSVPSAANANQKIEKPKPTMKVAEKAAETPAPPAANNTKAPENGNTGAGTVAETQQPFAPAVNVAPAGTISSIGAAIKGRAYTGGIDIFQSAKNDIPTDTTALYNAINKGSNRCSFLAIRLSDGASIAYNVNASYKCASSFKAVAALYAFKKAQEGVYSLNTPLTYTSADYYSGSGILKSGSVGATYTLRQVADYSIRYSDNIAYTMLQRYIDKAGFVEMVKNMGCSVYEQCKITNWPNVSAMDAALWWAEIYSFYQSSPTYGKELYDIYLGATNPAIKKALGGQYSVAHKSGSISQYFHDGGIVHAKEPYLLVVYTYNPANYTSDNSAFFAPLVREIDKLINP